MTTKKKYHSVSFYASEEQHEKLNEFWRVTGFTDARQKFSNHPPGSMSLGQQTLADNSTDPELIAVFKRLNLERLKKKE